MTHSRSDDGRLGVRLIGARGAVATVRLVDLAAAHSARGSLCRLGFFFKWPVAREIRERSEPHAPLCRHGLPAA